MRKLDAYLESIHTDESIFAMDSIHKNKKPLTNLHSEEAVPDDTERKRIMIDFDGVIHQYDSWNDGVLNDAVVDGAKEAIDELQKQNFEIVIFTTRASTTSNKNPSSSELVSKVKEWLTDHNIYFDLVTAEKLAAVAYIDDKAINFNNNWTEVSNKLKIITR